MIENWLIAGVMMSIIPVLFFVFVMFAQKIFMMLMKIKNRFLRWVSVLVAIVVVAMGMIMLVGAIFSWIYSPTHTNKLTPLSA